MITGSHVIVYSLDAAADWAFFRDVLQYPYVDAGGDWLIFKLPPAEIAVHPTDGCGAVSDEGWGLLTKIGLPGGGEIGMYEPRHPRATDL